MQTPVDDSGTLTEVSKSAQASPQLMLEPLARNPSQGPSSRSGNSVDSLGPFPRANGSLVCLPASLSPKCRHVFLKGIIKFCLPILVLQHGLNVDLSVPCRYWATMQYHPFYGKSDLADDHHFKKEQLLGHVQLGGSRLSDLVHQMHVFASFSSTGVDPQLLP